MFFKPGEDIPLYGDCSAQFSHLDRLSEIKPIVPKSIGNVSNFQKGSYGNIYQNLDVGSYFPNDSNTKGVQIHERFDFKDVPSLDIEFN